MPFNLYLSFTIYFTQKFIVFVSVSSITITLYNFYLFMRCLSNFQLRYDICRYSDSKSLHYRISSNKRPRSDKRPPQWPKYQTSTLTPPPPPPPPPPLGVESPPPSHFYSRAIRKTCFYCHFIDNSLCKLYNGTKVGLITNGKA